MAKTFNGRKMSHGPSRGSAPLCPICRNPMRLFLGELRCTEMKRTKGTKSGDKRVVNHGSYSTINKRLQAA